MNNKMVEEKIEKLKEACKKQHMRVTTQRIEILKEVASSTSHPDAEAIFEAVKSKLPNISIDTVYRKDLMLIKHRTTILFAPDAARFLIFLSTNGTKSKFLNKHLKSVRSKMQTFK